MTEPESHRPSPDAAPESLSPRGPSRLRRFFLRHLPLAVTSLVILLLAASAALYFWASSPGFEDMVRRRLVHRLETVTGGRVEIASFHWNLRHLEASASGIVIHGLEAPNERPYARLGSLRVGFSILGLWSPRLLLSDLEAVQPGIHLIVYPDGSTNQPHPRRPRKPGKPVLDTLFDLKAAHVLIDQGEIDIESRATDFDFQSRSLPINLDANNVTLRLAYVPALNGNPESYHLQASARRLNLLRAVSRSASQSVQGRLDLALDLTRNAAYLRALHLSSAGHDLNLSGSLQNFANPRWQGRVFGEFDLRLLDPITGYPHAEQGIARMDISAQGQDSQFRMDGGIHLDDAAYNGNGVTASGIGVDARVHADPAQLLITHVAIRLRQGGQIEGLIDLRHWLSPLPGAPVVEATVPTPRTAGGKSHPPAKPAQASSATLPVDGKVDAVFHGVSLDTVLDMVARGPYQHLGFNTLVSGPAQATWINGDDRTLAVSASFSLTPSGQAVPGEIAASGAVDGTYTHHDGAVDLRSLDLSTAASRLQVHGHLGAYPIRSSSTLALDFHSRNLADFDTLLRDLGLSRHGLQGASALPIALSGAADFHGTWTGSLIDPHIAGGGRATQIGIELPPNPRDHSGKPQFVGFDSIDASGSYSAARIDIARAQLLRGPADFALNGSLIAATEASGPAYGSANSTLRLHLRASKASLDDLLALTGRSIPVTGLLNTQLDLTGPIRSLNASGWAELDQGKVYGEPVARIRLQGRFADQVLHVTSATVNDQAGKILLDGSYDFSHQSFQIDARSPGLDVAHIDWLTQRGFTVSGRLGFSLTGAGPLDDPQLEARATVTSLALGGEPLGSLTCIAHGANRQISYDVATRLAAATLALHGQTALFGDNATRARLDFSRFNIGAILKQANIQGLNGESSLAGSVLLEGPLAHPGQMRGEARLQQLALTVAGILLQSNGGVHATLASGRIHLDPVRITGEETDIRAQGDLDLLDAQRLDFAANGAINLKVAQSIDPDLTASGNSTFEVEAHGPLHSPGLQGRIDFHNGSIALEDLPNSLSQLNGTLEFNQNRLEVKSLTALSGGGLLSVGGFLAYQNGLFADLSISGKGIRIRYPQGVSSLADATLRLQGPRNNLLLSGNILITRFAINPDFDMTALANQTASVQTIAPPNSPSSHFRLDMHLVSSPQLNFQNAYAKLAGDVDLHIRGTLASPSLLGRVSVTEGSAMIAGTRYELQRGDITFTNPVRIQPNIDLNATARVEDYDITLGIHGTLEKPTVAYRSDPPLPEADVVALLALGRSQSQRGLYTQQQEQAVANPTTDALLGGALNATVSSRVQRLFGAGSVKVDPNYLGPLGNATSRITVEEQLGPNITLTYATDVNTTAQQLIQADFAINRHVTLQVARDESGVFSMVFKATRRYR